MKLLLLLILPIFTFAQNSQQKIELIPGVFIQTDTVLNKYIWIDNNKKEDNDVWNEVWDDMYFVNPEKE